MVGTIGSNFDAKVFVEAAMLKESIPLVKLNKSGQAQEVTLSILGQLKGYIETLKKNIANISAAFKTPAFSTTVSDSKLVSSKITANENIYPTSHDLNVTKLAKAEIVGSVNAFSTRTDALSFSGNLNFSIGASTFSIDVNASDSLNSIRDKINNASNNNGVVANIVSATNSNGQTEYTLVVASKKTGIDNKVVVDGTAASNFNFANNISSAQNAEFTFDGKSVSRADNTVNDVIDGLSFSLLGVGQSTISIVANDTERNEAVNKSIHDMVASYNQAIDFLDQNVSERMISDGSLTTIKDNLRRSLTGVFNDVGKFTGLIDIGIKTAKPGSGKSAAGKAYLTTGKFEIDEAALKKVLSNNIDDLQSFFTKKTNGFVDVTDKTLDEYVKYSGVISKKTQSIQEEIIKINHKISSEEIRLQKVEEKLLIKYSAIAAMLDRFDKMSAYLDAQFNSGSKK